MNADLSRKLIHMQDKDLALRSKLAADGSLYDGYHPKMQACHEDNAAALENIIDQYGWPAIDMVGQDANEAAWLIAQHAIGLPDFQRRCLTLIEQAAEKGEVPRWQVAYLTDRIRVLEGRSQVYGTQFDWDEQGMMSPHPIEDEKNVDARRAAFGLPPLKEVTEKMRAENPRSKAPKNLADHKQKADQWARRTGWRSGF